MPPGPLCAPAQLKLPVAHPSLLGMPTSPAASLPWKPSATSWQQLPLPALPPRSRPLQWRRPLPPQLLLRPQLWQPKRRWQSANK